MRKFPLQEIDGFNSPGEFARFEKYIEKLISDGDMTEIDVDDQYEKNMVYGGRWLLHIKTKEIWRLVKPDFPYRGTWEPVKSPSGRLLSPTSLL